MIEVERHTRWRSTERGSNTAEIDNDSLDTVALALNLGLETLHLVAVKRVGNVLSCVLASGIVHRELGY